MTEKTIDKRTIRITISLAIMLILSIVGAAYQLGTSIERTNNNIILLQSNVNNHDVRIKDLEASDNEVKLQLAEINIKLANIERSLEEIKQEIKRG